MNKFIKKIFLSIVTLFLMLPFANVVFGSETKTQILYGKGGLNDPVRHYGTNKYVEVVSKYETAYSEMRGVWVATVYNIAISKQDGLNEEAIKDYKEEFISIFDSCIKRDGADKLKDYLQISIIGVLGTFLYNLFFWRGFLL